MTILISRTFIFGLNVTLMLVFNFTVLLSYRAIRVFLVQKFSCPVATHGHEPSSCIRQGYESTGGPGRVVRERQ